MYPTKTNKGTVSTDIKQQFAADVRSKFGELSGEIEERNQEIALRDGYIYSDRLERSLDIPLGHDFTPVNWLRRTVEIHKNMFMGRGFTVSSTYDTQDLTNLDGEDRKRAELENQRQKQNAESRMQTIKSIIDDNGGDALWATLAENASAVGDAAVKMYWDEDEKKIELCQIESVENLYALWNKNDFREVDAYAYVYQVSKQEAISSYGAPENVSTSPLGTPLGVISNGNTTGATTNISTQPMVTVMEVTGKVEGWASSNGTLKKVAVGKETELNALIIGDTVTRVIDEPSKLPKYYLLHNKTQRRRPWGMSDVTEAAISINLTYIETLSDWRTVASKVNFPKYKGFGFGPETQTPKFSAREIQILGMSEGQDLQELQQGDANGLDWGRQLEELKEQYIRESAVSRALFDDPSVTLNSNQALVTSMKTTTDIAEAKKQLWSPVLRDIFNDALEMAANHIPELKELVADDENWTLKIMWPSIMEKDDPNYRSMLLNQFNAGLLSPQSYLEQLGESKEELDRITEAMSDPVQASIMGHNLPMLAQILTNAATAEIQAWFTSMQPQPQTGTNTPGVNANGGAAAPAQIASTEQNQPGQQPVSQPGTGATAASPVGAVNQSAQINGV